MSEVSSLEDLDVSRAVAIAFGVACALHTQRVVPAFEDCGCPAVA